MPITIAKGNLFHSGCDALVNPVNCVGAMGAGLAKQFARHFPDASRRYQLAANRGYVVLGRVYVTANHDGIRDLELGLPELIPAPLWVVHFPTKSHWRDVSLLSSIEDGLASLRRFLETQSADSVAVPALGCGLGGLAWSDVEPLIHAALATTNVDVHLYPPGAAAKHAPRNG